MVLLLSRLLAPSGWKRGECCIAACTGMPSSLCRCCCLLLRQRACSARIRRRSSCAPSCRWPPRHQSCHVPEERHHFQLARACLAGLPCLLHTSGWLKVRLEEGEAPAGARNGREPGSARRRRPPHGRPPASRWQSASLCPSTARPPRLAGSQRSCRLQQKSLPTIRNVTAVQACLLYWEG